MRLKGTMILELTDESSGAVETVTEENMVTNAVNNILGLNSMEIFYTEADLSSGLVWNGNLLPICPHMIGGILLFSKTLEENADHIYEGSANLPVAYASNNVNSTANTARGSLFYLRSCAMKNKDAEKITSMRLEGRGAAEIADALHLRVNTVKPYLRAIRRQTPRIPVRSVENLWRRKKVGRKRSFVRTNAVPVGGTATSRKSIGRHIIHWYASFAGRSLKAMGTREGSSAAGNVTQTTEKNLPEKYAADTPLSSLTLCLKIFNSRCEWRLGNNGYNLAKVGGDIGESCQGVLVFGG